MSTVLPDVNVLIALHDTTHLYHDSAHRWFAKNKKDWATCPVTESAFVRITSNPKYASMSMTPVEAAAALADITRREGHRFWEDTVRVSDLRRFRWELVQGPGQITDIHLLALAVAKKGRFATFDRKIRTACVVGGESALEIIS